jgi:Fur family transcriptional regulator, iron response regulator
MSMLRPFGAVLERLKSVGLRPTRQRLALARLLFEAGDRHVTAEQLHSEAQAAKVRLSLATVYNTLHQFFFESEGKLEDIPGEQVELARIPAPPAGTRVSRVDVIVRVASNES